MFKWQFISQDVSDVADKLVEAVSNQLPWNSDLSKSSRWQIFLMELTVHDVEFNTQTIAKEGKLKTSR